MSRIKIKLEWTFNHKPYARWLVGVSFQAWTTYVYVLIFRIVIKRNKTVDDEQ